MVAMEWAAYVHKKHELEGPYEIEFLGEARDHTFFNSCGGEMRTFALRLTGQDGEITLYRRYKEIQQLAEAFGAAPAKRGLCYALCRGHREDTVRKLFVHVHVALEADPCTNGAALREFLGLELRPCPNSKASVANPEINGELEEPCIETEDTCQADVVGWKRSRGCVAQQVQFVIKVHILSDGQVFSHKVFRSLDQAQKLHRALIAEGLNMHFDEKALRPLILCSATLAKREKAFGAFVRQCTLLDVHLRSAALQKFFGLELQLDDEQLGDLCGSLKPCEGSVATLISTTDIGTEFSIAENLASERL